jgi:biopolymer transport protein ExbD
MSIKTRNKASLKFSMSSMSDMIFLLLIFFMISSTLISPNAIKLLLPQSSNQVVSNQFTTIRITADLKYFIDNEQIDFPQVESILRTKLKGIEDPTISLNTDRDVPIGEVVKIINIAKDNNYKLILATTQE